MSDPWTLTGPESVIAMPDKVWEKQGGRQILEGPEFLRGPKGDLFLTYSASACWSDDYALGLLHAPAGSNVLDPKNWTHTARPVFKSADRKSVVEGKSEYVRVDRGGRRDNKKNNTSDR